MMTMRLTALATLTLACMSAFPAEPASRNRTLPPDWAGQWEIAGATPSASGGYTQSLDEVLQDMRKWGPPPYTPAAQAIFNQVALRVHERSQTAFQSGVLPRAVTRPACTFGFPSVVLHSPLMFEILNTPAETAMIFSNREIRHIYTDGRAHTAPDDLFPTLWGDSIGHWEGQTLVVDTIAVSAQGGLKAIMAMGGDSNTEFELVALFSPEARFTERIRMLDRDQLEDQMTIIDPLAFSAPWVVNRRFTRVKTLNRMIHEDCEGEERNPIVDGKYTLAPPPAPALQLPPPFGEGPTALRPAQ
jgi:hypothetical protein